MGWFIYLLTSFQEIFPLRSSSVEGPVSFRMNPVNLVFKAMVLKQWGMEELPNGK